MDENKIIELYERLRIKAEENVLKSGVENLSFDLSEWAVVRNEDTRSVDLIINISINNKRESLSISYGEMELYIRGETSAIKVSHIIGNRIRVQLSEFVAEKIGERVFRAAASAIVSKTSVGT